MAACPVHTATLPAQPVYPKKRKLNTSIAAFFPASPSVCSSPSSPTACVALSLPSPPLPSYSSSVPAIPGAYLVTEAGAALQCMHAHIHQLQDHLVHCSHHQLQTLLQVHEQLTYGLPLLSPSSSSSSTSSSSSSFSLSTPSSSSSSASLSPHSPYPFSFPPSPSLLTVSPPSSSSWSSLPLDLLPSICHFLPSIRDLLSLTRTSRSFHTLLHHSDAVSRACWAHVPTLCLKLTRTGTATLCETWRDAQCESDPQDDGVTPPTVQCARLYTSAYFSSSLTHRVDRLLPVFRALRHIPAVSVHVALTFADALPLMLALLQHTRLSLRHLSAFMTVTETRHVEVLEAIAALPSLASLDLSRVVLNLNPRRTCSAVLPPGRCFPFLAPALTRLLHLRLWGDDLDQLSAHDIVLPLCRSLTISGLSPRWTLEGTSADRLRGLWKAFPALRYLNLPAQWHFPAMDDATRTSWGGLHHLRYNIAHHWTPHHPPPLPSLQSLHLDVSCTAVDLDAYPPAALERVERVGLEDEIASALSSLSAHLTHLTLSSRDLSYTASDQRVIDASFKLNIRTLLPLPSLTYLFLDCADLISKKFLSHLLLPNSLLSCRPTLRHLGLVLKVNCVMRVLACFSPVVAFPQLTSCHVRCHDDTSEHDGYRYDLGMRRERLEEHAFLDLLMRQKIGERVWASEEELVRRRPDVRWATGEALRGARGDGEKEEDEEQEEDTAEEDEEELGEPEDDDE